MAKKYIIRLIFKCLCFLVLQNSVYSQTPCKDSKIIWEMYSTYNGKWYPHLTFIQETVFYKNGVETHRQKWYEAATLPNQLIIKIEDLNGGNGVLFKQDTQYVFNEGKMVHSVFRIHDLMELGFNVYFHEPDKTIERLQKAGYDFSKCYERSWEGMNIVVVGAEDENDTKSTQFWIDTDNMLFVKLSKFNSEKNELDDIYFLDYKKIDNHWIAPRVEFWKNGQITLLELYNDIKFPESLDPEIFHINSFKSASW